MSRVITFSRFFSASHPRAGEPTHFVEKILRSFIRTDIEADESDFSMYWCELVAMEVITTGIDDIEPKHHTIRVGNRWKVGDKFSPRVWSGKPYRSKQIQFAPDIEIKKIWDFEMDLNGVFSVGGFYLDQDEYDTLALNDGLTVDDMFFWLMHNYDKPKEFKGQIISWNESISYS